MKVSFSGSVGYSAMLIDWVTSGQVDVAIVKELLAKLSLATESLAGENLVLVSNVEYRPRLPLNERVSRLTDSGSI